MQPRVFFYVQHLLGIGHLARASRVANALAEDGFAVSVNGDPIADLPKPGSYVEIKRTWKTGDKVSVTLPKKLHLEPLPAGFQALEL